MHVSFHYQQPACRCSEEQMYKDNQTMIHLALGDSFFGLCLDCTRELRDRLSFTLTQIAMLEEVSNANTAISN